MRDVQPWKVKLFLFQFKEFAQKNFSFAERDKGLDTIARLGITIQQAKEEILGLTYEDYYRGPIPDKGPKGGEYWEFGKTICEQEVFIKLKTVSKHGVAICFSFHIPDKTIEFPYKKGGQGK
jgi:hypothetical protein